MYTLYMCIYIYICIRKKEHRWRHLKRRLKSKKKKDERIVAWDTRAGCREKLTVQVLDIVLIFIFCQYRAGRDSRVKYKEERMETIDESEWERSTDVVLSLVGLGAPVGRDAHERSSRCHGERRAIPMRVSRLICKILYGNINSQFIG